jgi:hypothetical protein
MAARTKSKSTAKQKAMLAAIHRLRGSLKRKPGEKPFAQKWAEHNAAEKALEDRLDRRLPFRRRP